MANSNADQSRLHHQQIEVEGSSIHVIEAGACDQPAVLFLHGWPESWAMFKQIMLSLSTEAHVVAIDLPGVGASDIPPPDVRSAVRTAEEIPLAIAQGDT
jgi:pimeloyl-ACP methyl ester carboxylesterase